MGLLRRRGHGRRREVLGQKTLYFAQHLDAGLRVREPVVVAAKFHIADLSASIAQAVAHATRLIDRHDRVVGAVHQQDGNAYAIGEICGRYVANARAIVSPFSSAAIIATLLPSGDIAASAITGKRPT